MIELQFIFLIGIGFGILFGICLGLTIQRFFNNESSELMM
jgi:hypothetical protein